MADIKGVGVHCYLGGFAIGVARNENIRMLGSMESWDKAKTWAPRIGVKVMADGIVPRANYVFGNPPCSRFSSLSYSKYSAESRQNLDQFEDMEDVLLAAKYSGAELVHVESGPLMYSTGRDLISQFNDILDWPEIYYLILKISSTHSGLPQQRPRTHAFAAKHPFPNLDLTPVPLPENLGEFFRHWNSEYNFESVPSSDIPDPVVFASMQANQAVFLSTRPKLMSTYDRYAYSMVSSRHFGWTEENRWWSVDEYAGIQGYNPDFDYSEPGIPLAMALISKCVSPTIAEYLSHRVVVPYFDISDRREHGPMYIDLTAR